MDENPITGHPGAFNLSSTGRGKDAVSLQKVAAQNQAKAAAAAGEPEKPEVIPPTRKGSKADKSGKSGVPKIKRKKSKSAVPKSPAA